MQVTPAVKKTWAEDLLQKKYAELRRLTTKKDFDSASCAQIQILAFLTQAKSRQAFGLCFYIC